jgi:predicted nucleotidyltransferase
MEISRTVGIAHTSVKKNLTALVKLGFITEMLEKKGKRKFPVYTAKRENSLFQQHKQLYNLRSLYESNLIRYIEEKLSPRTIILFGSYKRGEDVEDSDIDVYVECRGENLALQTFEKKLGRKIELHFNENFASYPKELKNNLINGIVVSGFLEGYS